MSNKIGSQLVQAILAMQKDPSKLAVELKVHVFPCPHSDNAHHMHFKVTSPFVEDQTLAQQIEANLMMAAMTQEFMPVKGNYDFTQSLISGTKCTNEEVSDADTVQFLQNAGIVKALFDLTVALRDAFAEWPSELSTEHVLSAGYSTQTRKKLYHGTDTDPIKVEVVSMRKIALDQTKRALMSLFAPNFAKSERVEQNKVITLIAFNDVNPCSPVVRQAYAAYAQEMLDNKLEPKIAPKIVERVQLALDTLATRLAKQQATKLNETTTNPTQTAVGTEDGIGTEVGDGATKTTNVPQALSGGVGPGSSEVSFNPSSAGHDSNGQSTGATA
ncbi:MAG: hypothetical protein NTX72_01340 [Candidatus Uhrbacteria bacterium]|nr:hypothetical protein [Candidatus Uhrbacteria bacterium]